jgi:DNA-binding MarR family transcriptional regulator
MHATAQRIADQCLLMRTRRLARATTRIYLAHMGPLGLSVGQFTLLTAIGNHPGIRAADLGPALDMDTSTVSRELAALIQTGLVVAERLDGRSQSLRLSPEGSERLSKAEPAWERAQAEAAAALGPLAGSLLEHYSSS